MENLFPLQLLVTSCPTRDRYLPRRRYAEDLRDLRTTTTKQEIQFQRTPPPELKEHSWKPKEGEPKPLAVDSTYPEIFLTAHVQPA